MIGVSLKVSKTISKNLPFKPFQKPDHAPDADDLDECFSRGSGNFVGGLGSKHVIVAC